MFIKRRNTSEGFTILELMIAASVFSVILLVVASGVISFTNDYYKGITSSKTQDIARSVINTLTQAIQFCTTPPASLPASGNAQGFCIGNTMYSYVIGQQLSDTPPDGTKHQAWHSLVADNSGCGVPNVPNSNAALLATQRELLGPHMRLSALDITSS